MQFYFFSGLTLRKLAWVFSVLEFLNTYLGSVLSMSAGVLFMLFVRLITWWARWLSR